jgi:FlaG/FlaF family flagellin (archaellin)
VADATGTIFPRSTVSLSGTLRADFGMRPIVRSTDAGAPVSSYVGATGLTVKSYDDAASAREIYDRLMTGALVGTEAKDVTIRFDFAQSGNTSSLAVQSNGVYTDYRATSDVTWAGWLRGDGELLHEYGHACTTPA